MIIGLRVLDSLIIRRISLGYISLKPTLDLDTTYIIIIQNWQWSSLLIVIIYNKHSQYSDHHEYLYLVTRHAV